VINLETVFKSLNGDVYTQDDLKGLNALTSAASLRLNKYKEISNKELGYLKSNITRPLIFLDFKPIFSLQEYNLKENKGKERIRMDKREKLVFVDFPLVLKNPSKTKKNIYNEASSEVHKWFKDKPLLDFLDLEELSGMSFYDSKGKNLKEKTLGISLSRGNDRFKFSLTYDYKEKQKDPYFYHLPSKREVDFWIKGKLEKKELEKEVFGIGTPLGAISTWWLERDAKNFGNIIFGSDDLKSEEPHVSLNYQDIEFKGLADYIENEMMNSKLEEIKNAYKKSVIKDGLLQIERETIQPLTSSRICIDIEGLKKGLPKLSKELGI